MSVAKIVELIASSDKGFDDALQQLISRAVKTIRHVTGVNVLSQKVKLKEGKIVEYRINAKVAFEIETPKK
jgi:flavin-binding protein dodecin